MHQKHGMMALLTLGLGLLMGLQALAAPSLPFARRGVIDRIDLQNRIIVVNDAVYVVPASMQVHLFYGQARRPQDQQPQPQVLTAVALRQGMHIGFNVEGEGAGQKGKMIEAWILMPGSLHQSRE
jgi:hypothetical protein